jgi:hypothetical protein
VRGAIAIALVCAAAGVVHASEADDKFKQGKRLLGLKHYAEACAAFERSDELEPQIGTKLNVGKCYEDWGKLATAYKWYADAAKMATDTRDDRLSKIKALIDSIDSDVPRLTIKVNPDGDVPGAHITLDGAPFADDLVGVEQRVDPGSHQIEYRGVAGPKSKTVPLEKGGSSELTLELAKAPPKPLVVAHPAGPRDGHTQRIAGITLGSAGVVALGVAGIVTLRARSDYKHGIDAHCNGAADMCDATGLDETHSARHRANLMTIVASVGGAAIAGGIVLFVLAPHRSQEHAVTLAPAFDSTGGGFTISGAF